MKVANVPRLPHKSRLRLAKCHACHATSGGAKSDPIRRLPHKSKLRCAKCHACHATSGGAKSDPIRRQASADIYEGSERNTPAAKFHGSGFVKRGVANKVLCIPQSSFQHPDLDTPSNDKIRYLRN